MIRLFVEQTAEGFEAFWKYTGERWKGETIQQALGAFERSYVDYYGTFPIYTWQ